MTWINAVLRVVFDAALAPFAGSSPWVGVTLVSLLCATGMLWIFKRTSNQAALAAVKSRIHAGLFEIRLFNDDLPAIFRAQTQILKANTKYLWHSLPPMIWVIMPLAFVFAQLQFHYGYVGLEPGESALLTLRFEEGSEAASGGAKPDVDLTLPEGVALEAGPVWAPALRELTWRIGLREAGDHEAVVALDGTEIRKEIRATDRLVRLSPLKVAPGLLDQFLYPAEDPISGAPSVEALKVSYQSRLLTFFGWEMPWWLAFFILVIAFAFALRNPMGVTI
ncbi:MAG: hypothetical protein ACE5GX_08420 [Thermoanaerobaculia bacterium]